MKKAIRKVRINPAILTGNLSDYYLQIANLFPEVNEFDIDIIEWSRTGSKTISIEEALSVKAKIIMNFDMMVDYPSQMIDLLCREDRVQRIILNTECKDNIGYLIDKIHFYKKQAGVAVNPEDTIDQIEKFLQNIELVEIFSIEPGAQGNPMIPERLQLANVLRSKGFAGLIELDGSVNEATIPMISKFPFDVLSVGSAISSSPNPINTYSKLLELANK